MLTTEQADLAARHVRLARHIAAQRFTQHHGREDFDDLFSDAQLGLLSAAARYDADRSHFITFATPRIHGAITDGLRARDPLGRADRGFVNRINWAQGHSVKTRGRLATDQELAADLDVTPAVLASKKTIALRAISTSLDAELESQYETNLTTLHDLLADPTAEDGFNAPFARQVPAAALEALPSRERLVIGLYFWQDHTLRDIGAILGVTESRVSQLLSKALQRLRERVSPELTEVA